MKMLGGVILLITALYYSKTKQQQEQTKLTILTELCDLFGYLQKNIEHFSSPLGDLFRSYTSPALAKWNFYTVWQEHSLAKAVCQLPGLSEGIRKTLTDYDTKAGQGYKEEELQLCRYTREILSEELQRKRQESGGKNKLYKTMPFLLVLSIVLLFW